MTAPNVELLRHMQWWVLRMVCEEVKFGDTGLPAAPPLSLEDRRKVYWWLNDCAEAVSPGVQVAIEFQHHGGHP